MALTKDVQDWVTITPDGVFEHRRTTTAYDDDGSVLGTRHHRVAYPPNTDKATMPPKLAAIANVVWTPAVIAAWVAKQAENDNG